ncbi:hypothetical protein NWF32_00700 [Pseudomonas qingdaonensis]|nr:hypothetical protein [Pseudomonas qingdaonensis]
MQVSSDKACAQSPEGRSANCSSDSSPLPRGQQQADAAGDEQGQLAPEQPEYLFQGGPAGFGGTHQLRMGHALQQRCIGLEQVLQGVAMHRAPGQGHRLLGIQGQLEIEFGAVGQVGLGEPTVVVARAHRVGHAGQYPGLQGRHAAKLLQQVGRTAEGLEQTAGLVRRVHHHGAGRGAGVHEQVHPGHGIGGRSLSAISSRGTSCAAGAGSWSRAVASGCSTTARMHSTSAAPSCP